MPKIIHYRNKCIGCGVCVELQPDSWRMSKNDGKAMLAKASLKNRVFVLEIPPFALAQSQATAEACPARVIKVL